MSFTYALYDSLDTVPAAEWDSLRRPEGDPFMDLRFLRAVGNSLGDSARLWYVILRDAQRRPAAIAVICSARIDGKLALQGRAKRFADAVAKFRPHFLQIPLVFCGLPIASGQSFLRIAPETDAGAVLRALEELLGRLAAEERARCVVFREFEPQEQSQFDCLQEMGYLRVNLQPTNVAEGGHRDFEDFLENLNCDRRRHLRKSQRKFAAMGLRVVQMTGRQGADRLITDDVYRLYEGVFQRHAGRFEKLPAEFFRELARQLPDQTVYTFVYQGERIAAFAVSLFGGSVYHAMFCGFDYALNPSCDLYFNMFFHLMDYGYRQGATLLFAGQTSDTFKQRRLRCRPRSLCCYIKAVRPLASFILRHMGERFLPQIVAGNEPAGSAERAEEAASCF